jgi:hypothetical protein
MKKRGKCNNSQVSVEYIIIMGFVTFTLIGIMSIGFIYSNAINDRIRIIQLYNCADKILSTSESVFYMGAPSKSTITCYFPENIENIEILENTIFFSIRTSSGISKMAFSSNVPISGTLNHEQGIKRIQVEAETSQSLISLV